MDKFKFQNSGFVPNVFQTDNAQKIRMPLIDTSLGTSMFDQNIDPNQFLIDNQYSPEDQLKHMRAQNQPVWDAFGRGMAKLGTSIVTGLARMPFEGMDMLIPGEDPFSKVSDILDKGDEVFEDWFKVYESKKYDESGFFGKALTTQAGLANDFGGGLSFILQNWITGGLAAEVKLGSKAVQMIQKLGLGGKALQDAAKARKIGDWMEDNVVSLLSSINESAIEADGVKNAIMEKGLERLGKDVLAGRTPGESYEDLEKRATHAWNTTAAMNMALLTASNLIDRRVVRGTYAEELNKMLVRSLTKPEEITAREGLKTSLNIGKAFGAGFIKEGVGEENMQTAIQRYEEAYHPNHSNMDAVNRIGKNFMQGITGLGKYFTGGEMTAGEKEQGYAAVLGGLIGGPFNAWSEHKDAQRNKEELINASKFGDFLKSKIVPIDDIWDEEVRSVYDKNEDGSLKLNPAKMTKYLNNLSNKAKSDQIAQYALLNGDKLLYSVIEPQAMAKQAYRLFNNDINAEVKDILMAENTEYNKPLSQEDKDMGRTKSNKEILDETFKIFEDTTKEHNTYEKQKPENAPITKAYVKQIAYLKSTINILKGLSGFEKGATSKDVKKALQTGEEMEYSKTVDYVAELEAAIDELTAPGGYEEFSRLQREMDDSHLAVMRKNILLAAEKTSIDSMPAGTEKDTALAEYVKKQNEHLYSVFLDQEKKGISGYEQLDLASELKGIMTRGPKPASTAEGLKGKVKEAYENYKKGTPVTIEESKSATFDQQRSMGRTQRGKIPTIEEIRHEAGKNIINEEDVKELFNEEVMNKLSALKEMTEQMANAMSTPQQFADAFFTTVNGVLTTDPTITQHLNALVVEVGNNTIDILSNKQFASILSDAEYNMQIKPYLADLQDIKEAIGNLMLTIEIMKDGLIEKNDTQKLSPTEVTVVKAADTIKGYISDASKALPPIVQELEALVNEITNNEYTTTNDAMEKLDVLKFDYIMRRLGLMQSSLDLRSDKELDDLINELTAVKAEYGNRDDVRQSFKDRVDKKLAEVIEAISTQKKKAGQETAVREKIQSLLNERLLQQAIQYGINLPPEVTTIKGLTAYIATLDNKSKAEVIAKLHTDFSIKEENYYLSYETAFLKTFEGINQGKLEADIKLVMLGNATTDNQIALSKLDKTVLKLLSGTETATRIADSLPVVAHLLINEDLINTLLPYKQSKLTDQEFKDSFNFTLNRMNASLLVEMMSIDKTLLSTYISKNVSDHSINAQQQLSEIGILKLVSDLIKRQNGDTKNPGPAVEHMLIQGLAGAGKSRTLNSVINSLLGSDINVNYATLSRGEDSTVKAFKDRPTFNEMDTTTQEALVDHIKTLSENSGILVIDEAYLLTDENHQAILDHANAMGIPIVFAGDVSQNLNNNLLNSFDYRINNKIKLSPTLSISYRTGHPGIAKLYDAYYLVGDEKPKANNAVANTVIDEDHFTKDTRGSFVTKNRNEIVPLIKKDTGRTKLVIVGDSEAKAFYASQGIEEDIIKLWDEIQGMEADEVFVDVQEEQLEGQIETNDQQNRLMYTALSRAKQFVAMVQMDDSITQTNFPTQEVSIKSYEEEFDKLEDDYVDAVNEAAAQLGVTPPVRKERKKAAKETKKDDTEEDEEEEEDGAISKQKAPIPIVNPVATDALTELKKVANISDEQATDIATVLGRIASNIAKRLGITVDEYKKRLAFKTVKDVQKGVETFVDTLQNVDLKDIVVLNQDIVNADYQVNPKYLRVKGMTNTDFWLSKIMDISDLTDGSNGLVKLHTLNTVEEVRKEINNRYAELSNDLLFNTDKYLVQDLSPGLIQSRIDYNTEHNNVDSITEWTMVRDYPRAKAEKLRELQEIQRGAIKYNLDYLAGNPAYSTEFQYLAIYDMTKYKYEIDGDTVKVINMKPSIWASNINPINSFNPIALSIVYGDYADKGTRNVGAAILKNSVKVSVEEIEQDYSKYKYRTIADGTWLKFPKGSNQEDIELLNKLAKKTQSTPASWCTGGAISTTADQLKAGDFYVLVDANTGFPRVAVKYVDNRIDELRGLGLGQSLLPEDTNIVNDVVENFKDGSSYKTYRDVQKNIVALRKGTITSESLSLEEKVDILKQQDLSHGQQDKLLKQYKDFFKEEFKNNPEFLIVDKGGPLDTHGFYDLTGKKYFIDSENTDIIYELSGIEDLKYIEVGNRNTVSLKIPRTLKLDYVGAKNINFDNPQGTLIIEEAKLNTINLANSIDQSLHIKKGTINELTIENYIPTLNDVSVGLIKIRYDSDALKTTELLDKIKNIDYIETSADVTSINPIYYRILNSAVGINDPSMIPLFEKAKNLKFDIDERYDNIEISDGPAYNISIYGHDNLTVTFKNSNELGMISLYDLKEFIPSTGGIKSLSLSGVRKADLSNLDSINYLYTDSAYSNKATDILTSVSNIPIVHNKATIHNAIIDKLILGSKSTEYANAIIKNDLYKIPPVFGIEPVIIKVSEMNWLADSVLHNKTPGFIPNNDMLAIGITNYVGVVTDNVTADPANVVSVLGLEKLPFLFTESFVNKQVPVFRAMLDKSRIVPDVLYQDERGAIVKAATQSAILLSKKDADVTTPIHEMVHEYERVLNADEIQKLEAWSNLKYGTTEFSEAFAKGAEKYIYEGSVGTRDVDGIFARLAKWFKDVIKDAIAYFGDINELNDDVRAIYAAMLAEEVKAAPQVQPDPVVPTGPTDTNTTQPINEIKIGDKFEDDNFIYTVLGRMINTKPLPGEKEQRPYRVSRYDKKTGVEDSNGLIMKDQFGFEDDIKTGKLKKVEISKESVKKPQSEPIAKTEDAPELEKRDIKNDTIRSVFPEETLEDEELNAEFDNNIPPAEIDPDPNVLKVSFPRNTRNLGPRHVGPPIIVRFKTLNNKGEMYKVYGYTVTETGSVVLHEVGVLGKEEIAALGARLPKSNAPESWTLLDRARSRDPIPADKFQSMISRGDYITRIDDYELEYYPFKHRVNKKDAKVSDDWLNDLLERFVAAHNKSNKEQPITIDDIKKGISVRVFTIYDMLDQDNMAKRFEGFSAIRPGVPYLAIKIPTTESITRKPILLQITSAKYGSGPNIFAKLFKFFNRPDVNWKEVKFDIINYINNRRLPESVQFNTKTGKYKALDNNPNTIALAEFLTKYTNTSTNTAEIMKVVKDKMLDTSVRSRNDYTYLMNSVMKAVIESIQDHLIGGDLIKDIDVDTVTFPELQSIINSRQMQGRDPESEEPLLKLDFVPANESDDLFNISFGTDQSVLIGINSTELNDAFKEVQKGFRQIGSSNKEIAGFSTRNLMGRQHSRGQLSLKTLLPKLDVRTVLGELRRIAPEVMKMFIFSSNRKTTNDIDIVSNGKVYRANGFTEFKERLDWYRTYVYKHYYTNIHAHKDKFPEETALIDVNKYGNDFGRMWEDIDAFDLDDYTIISSNSKKKAGVKQMRMDSIDTMLIKLNNIKAVLNAQYVTFNTANNKFVFSERPISSQSIKVPIVTKKGNASTLASYSDFFANYKDQLDDAFDKLNKIEKGEVDNSLDWNALAAATDKNNLKDLYKHIPLDETNHIGDVGLDKLMNEEGLDLEDPNIDEMLKEHFRPITQELQFPIVQLRPKGKTPEAAPVEKAASKAKSKKVENILPKDVPLVSEQDKKDMDKIDYLFSNPGVAAKMMVNLLGNTALLDKFKIKCK